MVAIEKALCHLCVGVVSLGFLINSKAQLEIGPVVEKKTWQICSFHDQQAIEDHVGF